MLDFGYTCQTLLEIHGNPSDFVRTTKKTQALASSIWKMRHLQVKIVTNRDESIFFATSNYNTCWKMLEIHGNTMTKRDKA